MRNVLFLIIMALTVWLVQVDAAMTVVLEDPGSNGTLRSSTFSNLDAKRIKSSYKIMAPSGSLSSSDMNSAESFQVTVSGVSDWNYAAAAGAGSVNAYLKSLTPANIVGNDKGWGVEGSGSGIGNFDGAGEALVVTFKLSGLTAAHQSNFRLKGMGVYIRKVGAYNYMVIDASGDLVVASASGQTSDMIPMDVAINDGDTLVVSYKAGSFKLNNFTVDAGHNQQDVVQKQADPVSKATKEGRRVAGIENRKPAVTTSEPADPMSKISREDRKAAKKEERKMARVTIKSADAMNETADPISIPSHPVPEPESLGLIL